ncbi:unnamed protein product [Closterium sp. NIES-64]|nr:unnamed protein product [Closterium sp. NIES-64]
MTHHNVRTVLIVALVLVLAASITTDVAAWRVSCAGSAHKTPGRQISELQTSLEKEKVPAFTFGRRQADGFLEIRVFRTTDAVNVKFELRMESIYMPVTRTINFGPKGALGPALISIPGIPSLKNWRDDGPKIISTGWIMNAHRTPSLNDPNVTVADVLEKMDTNPGAYYASITTPINALGLIRGQFRRDAFRSCRLF